jgi:glutamyl-tRNA synthetase
MLKLTKQFIPEHEAQIPDLLKIFGSRLNYLAEIKDLSTFIFSLPDYDGSLLIFKKSDNDKTKQGLKAALEILTNLKDNNWQENKLFSALEDLVKAQNLTPGDVFWPIRVCLSGLEKSPSPAEILAILGKKESIRRIELGLAKIK